MENEQTNTSATPNTAANLSDAQMLLRRAEDFVSRYANNVQFESSAFDLKVVFGLLDQSGAPKFEKPSVEQHTAISLSWLEVKLVIFFLQLHLAGYEAENGKVKVPISALPSEPPSSLPRQFDTPESRKSLERIRKLRAEFLANLSQP
jgi:hypothetical protein